MTPSTQYQAILVSNLERGTVEGGHVSHSVLLPVNFSIPFNATPFSPSSL